MVSDVGRGLIASDLYSFDFILSISSQAISVNVVRSTRSDVGLVKSCKPGGVVLAALCLWRWWPPFLAPPWPRVP